MTIARSASLTKIEDFDFDVDLASVSRETSRIVDAARKALDTGEAFILEKKESRYVLDAIQAADVFEKGFSSYKSLLIYLWFEGRGDDAIGISGGASYLAGCIHCLPETIKKLRLIGQVRWKCLMLGLPLELFSDRAVAVLRPLLDDPDELERKHHEVVDGFWKERERIKQEREAGTSLYPKPLPKLISHVNVQRCLGTGEGGCYTKGSSATAPDDTGKADSNGSNDQSPVDQSDDLDDKIDDLGRVRLRLAEAEQAVESLVRRFPKLRNVVALEEAVFLVAKQARDLVLTKAQADSLWRARR